MNLSTFALFIMLAIASNASFCLSSSAAPEIAAPKSTLPVLRDVMRGDSQDFFKVGRQQFEQEVQEFQRRPLTAEILKIDSKLRRVDDESLELPLLDDRPNDPQHRL